MAKMKKWLAGILCVASVGTALLAGCGGGKSEAQKHEAFINELGGVSETYKGSVSQDYASANAAATAYVEEEIVGFSGTASNVVATSKGAVSAEKETEIKTTLSDADKVGIVNIEEYEVSYSEAEAFPMAADTLNTNKTVKVYVISYADHFKYYTPCPITGETITQSYYNSLFDEDNYTNCTVETKMEIHENVKASGSYEGVSMSMTVKMDMEFSQYVQFSETAIYVKQDMTMKSSGMGAEDMNVDATVYAYIENTGTGMNCYVKTKDTPWVQGELDDIDLDYEDLVPFADEYLDYSYFTKTNYGFELNEANAAQYVEESLDDLDFFGDGIEIFAKYYVCGGKLSGMRMDMTMAIDMLEEGMTIKGDVKAFAETKVTNYGTTKVTRPADIS